MDEITMSAYQAGARRTYTREELMTREGIAYTALGLAGEAGELANKIKKILRGDYEADYIREDIAAELGDVLWYAAMLAAEFDLSLEDVARANLEKLAARQARGTIKGSGDER